MKIDYYYDNAGLFGNEYYDDIDAPASIEKYDNMVTDALRKEFPDADIETHYGPTMKIAEVDGDESSNDAERVSIIGSEVWESWKWIVTS